MFPVSLSEKWVLRGRRTGKFTILTNRDAGHILTRPRGINTSTSAAPDG